IVRDLFCAVASEWRRANNASRKVKALDAALRGSRFEHQAPAAILGPASFRGDGGEPHTTWREGGRAAIRIAENLATCPVFHASTLWGSQKERTSSSNSCGSSLGTCRLAC